ncbi:4-aminobutyrate--2-oxoglutarate transaminase [Enterovibrio nigricans]|uniref:4-aminobutyrate aminotransferase apoenzyme n=1 Tax=Enterovibrio nigricans DSM 22720 TaxID=1121868 RepID=A0A1T4V9X2_9GAMM|nr:4-aminobutyrate--2-oxoglutarate transaminase [Enterovibrio nigricans]PKF50056.1 4-aminobutyrate--2-oxoglutarate transaminase [Enterovibrio nigricans]SKA61733.1 4-aminobutyrate aminotransferase apoenzyme [Enterovibrio nigricans DSM 22720]
MNNQSLMERRNAAVPRGVASATPLFVKHAKNAELWDVENTRYIDFAAGIAVVNTGHSNPTITQAVTAQIDKFSHTAFQVAGYENYIELAERLNALAPIDEAKTILMTTGAEAVENAVKIARHYTQRRGVIAFHGGFHGRTLLTMGMTGKIAPYKEGFGPFPGDIYHIPFPVPYQGIDTAYSLQQLEKLFKTDISPTSVAAIVIEPIQGEGGFYAAPEELIQQLRTLCDEHGIVLIFDEVQTGFGRTGKTFASEHYDVQPDMITVAKALAGGYPLSGIIGKRDIMDSPTPGGLGGTYGGSPVGCAAALAVLAELESKSLNDRAQEIGDQLHRAFSEIIALKPNLSIGHIRHKGAMFAFDFLSNSQPDPSRVAPFVKACRDNGLIVLPCGQFGNAIRLLPPLTVENHIMEEAIDIMKKALLSLH